MNGRVYDPALGRFISADPIVQAPGNLQSFNRYAYVWNGPLSATDPSGFDEEDQGDLTCNECSAPILEDSGNTGGTDSENQSFNGIAAGAGTDAYTAMYIVECLLSAGYTCGLWDRNGSDDGNDNGPSYTGFGPGACCSGSPDDLGGGGRNPTSTTSGLASGSPNYADDIGASLASISTATTATRGATAHAGDSQGGAGNAAPIHVRVYIWTSDLTKNSVGHAMVTDSSGSQSLLSQFPHKAGAPTNIIGPNIKLSVDETFAEEKRGPSSVYDVTITNVQEFQKSVSKSLSKSNWFFFSSPFTTDCSQSAFQALEAGGAISPMIEIFYGNVIVTPDLLNLILDYQHTPRVGK